MKKRALVLAEGHTEERFIKEVLCDHFCLLGLDLAPTLLITKRVKQGGSFRGGVTSFGKFENDVRRLLGSSGGALVTTLLDYYGLPPDFPGMDSRPTGDPLKRVQHVEAAIKAHFDGRQDFLPYLSLHEFEALLFVSPEELSKALMPPAKAAEFAAVRAGLKTPEDINERPGQAPSQRIAAISPAYRKKFHGPTIAGRIGLDRLRAECPHFHEWLNALEAYARGC